MPKLLKKPKFYLSLILILALFLRTFRIWYPNAYIFDEVYHAFTAKEYLKGSAAAWEWWTIPPPGVAYEWTHPPLAKEMMATSMWLVHSTDAWAWRLPGALLGTLAVWLIYLIAKKLEFNERISLTSAFIFSLDGLNFVQSRTGMNDIYVVTFMLASLLFLLHKRFFLAALFLGLALSSKWTGVYLFALLTILGFKSKQFKDLLFLIAVPPFIYLLSYLPFFLLGHSFNQFKELQNQMWYYHSHLKATHDYASPWWSWPLNLYPVWYYVQYGQNSISNIFTSGNPIVFWSGAGAILITLFDYIKSLLKKQANQSFLVILLGFFVFWLPWAFSPRIMFLYHYSPSVPFLSLALGYQIGQIPFNKNDKFIFISLIVLIILGFLLVYPMLTGIPLPKNLMEIFFRTNLTKNPFGG